ncbi:anthrone oxygenase family protein [Deinococcus sp.]|uniref:anthrone oxygenase family protein n=1 Tax=Deinococcus sp. TaxID=47478 RepID=UPI003B592E31
MLWLVAAALAGLNAGILVSGWLEGWYMRRVGLSAFLQMHQPRDLLLRRMMPPLLLTLMACCLGLAALAHGSVYKLLALLAFALVLADVLLTVRLLVPLNLQLGSYNALSPPPNGQAVRQRWYGLHPLRTALGALAFVLLLLIGVS